MDQEDISQTTLLKAFVNVDGFRNASKWTTWLYEITKNTALDAGDRLHTRHRNEIITEDPYETLLLVPDPSMDPEQSVILQEEHDRLVADMQGLSNEQKTTLLLLGFGYSCAEIAEQLDMPVNTVKSHMHRGRETLFAIKQSREREAT